MKLYGMCLRTIDEQREGGDVNLIEPESVKINNPVPVTLSFGNDIIGMANVELVDGRLFAYVETENDIPFSWQKLAVSIAGNYSWLRNNTEEYIIKECDLVSIGIVIENKDKGIEAYRVITVQ